MSRYDDAPKRKTKVKPTGEGLPPGGIAIVDERGNRRGYVHGKASAATVSRFGVRNAKLTKGGDGKPVWTGDSDATARRRAALSRAQHVKANKGSVSFKPTAPQTTARPKRGS